MPGINFGFVFVFACLLTAALPSYAHVVPSHLVALDVPTEDYPGVPGVVVTHSPASSQQYIGSPGLVILPNGYYLAKCDLFGPGVNDEQSGTTSVFESQDRGVTWTHLTDVTGLYWASIFPFHGSVYMLGTYCEYGQIVIVRSDDGGHTWTAPKDNTTGFLTSVPNFHCAPVPVIESGGRLWRAFEQRNPATGWAQNFRAFMLSAPVGADLLRADSWTGSVPLANNSVWNGGDFGGWLEGNAVVTPTGQMVDILRVAVTKLPEKAAIAHISTDGTTGVFDPIKDVVDFPGGATKFTIRFDPVSGIYWSLANYIPAAYAGGDPGSTRNTLALISSPDLYTWTVRSVLLTHSDPTKYGFQYVDWQFDGADIVAASRTAFDDGLGGANDYHNANFLTFHRFAGFRGLTMASSDPVLHYKTNDFVISGHGFKSALLLTGGQAFSNRAYVWTDIPAALQNWHFTQLAGGAAADITVTAKRNATLHFATALSLPGLSTAGWTATGQTFHYNDGGKTALTVFSRQLKTGETVSIPQGNWTGGLVLLP